MTELWEYDESGECHVKDCGALPQPLVHMLANGPQYFSICDNYLRGYSGFDYTRMFGEFDGQYFPKDNGRFLWLRFPNGETWLANNHLSDGKSAEHSFAMGQGYVVFKSRSKRLGIEVKATVFVPLEEMSEIWIVEIGNISDSDKKVDFIPTVPIFGGSRAYTEYHRDVVRLYNKCKVTDRIELRPGLEWVEGKTSESAIAYYMSAETSDGTKGDRFYTDRETFLGSKYSWLYPEAILENKPPRFQCIGKEAVGAIEFKGVDIKPGSSAKFVIVNGISRDFSKTEEKILKFNYKNSVQELEKLKTFWGERTSRVSIRTGSRNLDLCWNKWWCYQLSMRYWFGNTGHPQFDYGSDFAGWRDFWQDMMAATVIDPVGLEKRTLHTLEGIRLDGTNATRFFARTKEFGSDEINGLWCDHSYWTTQTVLLLISFLGDQNFIFRGGIAYFRDCYRDRGERKDLSCQQGYIERQKTTAGEVYKGTVIEHLLVQLLTMFYDVGKNNLLKQKRADWNDAVDQVRGENVTFSLGLAQDCNDLADFLENTVKRTGVADIEIFEELADLIETKPEEDIIDSPYDARQHKLLNYLEYVNESVTGKKVKISLASVINDLRAKAKATIINVNKIAWTGEYYTGYFYDDGKAVDGIFVPHSTSKSNATTEDYVMMLMPQTWSLLSGASDESGRTEQVIKSVSKLLADKSVGGLKLNYPPYLKFDPNVGRITGFAPGTKENNAIFCHANLFFVYALLKRRMPDEAYKIFSGINPLDHAQEILRTGPWIPEYYISSDNPNWPGRGEYPLLTASAGWTRFIFQNYFFGVRGELDGLRIDPCLPSSPEFKNAGLDIHFRGAFYSISIHNPALKANARIKSITVDGKKLAGNLIKPFDKGEHKVEVIMDGGQ